MSAKESLEKIVARINPSQIEGVTTNLHFNFGGGADYTIAVADGKAEFKEGFHGEPECVLTADADDFVKITSGDMNPMMAVMMGKLKLSNAGAMMKYAGMLGLM